MTALVAAASDTTSKPDHVARVLARRPRGLFADIDGTLSALVDRPEEATVDPGCREALRLLTRTFDLVCVLTGRPADDAWRMVGVDEALYVGNHGAETWYRGELLRPPGSERYLVRLARARDVLRSLLAGIAAISFEDKGIGFAIHYRRDLSVEPQVVEAATRVARRRGLEVVRRTAHVEIRAPLTADKGTALRELAARHGLQALAVIGDDPVDAPAFEAARAHAAATGADSVIFTVGDRVRDAADVALAAPSDACRLLSELARRSVE